MCEYWCNLPRPLLDLCDQYRDIYWILARYSLIFDTRAKEYIFCSIQFLGAKLLYELVCISVTTHSLKFFYFPYIFQNESYKTYYSNSGCQTPKRDQITCFTYLIPHTYIQSFALLCSQLILDMYVNDISICIGISSWYSLIVFDMCDGMLIWMNQIIDI